MMMPVVQSCIETLGVILLALIGVWLGHRSSKLREPLWLLGYILPFALLAVIAVCWNSVTLEFIAPFSWIMTGRREFALLALIITSILTTPLSRLKHKGERIAVVVFMSFTVITYSVLPFLAPAFNYSYLSTLKTTYDSQGVCMQSNGYNCGPAAAVTALRQLGITAEEGELAILAHSTTISGTPCDNLCTAIEARYGTNGVRCHFLRFDSIQDMSGKEPVIAIVKYAFLVDHYVTVQAVHAVTIEIGDPLDGKQTLTHPAFIEKWRNAGIVVERTRQ